MNSTARGCAAVVCTLTALVGQDAAQPKLPKLSFRTQLREIVDREPPPERVEIEGRIFEPKALARIANKVYGDRTAASVTDVIVMQLLRDRLVASKHYLSDEDFEKAFSDYSAVFDKTPFNTRWIATKFKGYPSLEVFRTWWRLSASFERKIQSEVTDAVLLAHAKKHAGFFGNGGLAMEVAHFAAQTADNRWDFAAARARAVKAWAAAGKDFAKLRKAADPSPGKAPSGRTDPFNTVRQCFGETEFTDRRTGTSAAAAAFFRAPAREVVGPIQGPTGWWFARLGKRKTGAPITNLNDRMKQLVRQHYLEHRFLEWVRKTEARFLLRRPR